MPVEGFTTLARFTTPICCGVNSFVHYGWEDYRPKKYHPEKLAASLLYQALPLPSLSESSVSVFCGVSEMHELKRLLSPKGFRNFVLAPLDESLFIDALVHARESQIFAFIGASPAKPSSPEAARYCHNLRMLYPKWGNVLVSYLERETTRLEATRAPVIVCQEKPGRFFALQTRNRSIKMLRRNPLVKKAPDEDIAGLAERAGWAAGVIAVTPQGKETKVFQAVIDGRDLWERMDSFEGLAEKISELTKEPAPGGIERFVFTGFPKEMAGILGGALSNVAAISQERFAFPDLLWGNHFFAHFTDFLLESPSPSAFIFLQSSEQIRVIVKTSHL